MNFFKKDSSHCVAFAFLSTVVIMLFVFFAFDMFPFGDTTILRMDLYHQYGPLFAELYERVTRGESLLYSWNTGGGGGFLGNFFNYLSSPVAVIIYFLGHKNIPEAIALMVMIKASLASASFCWYLKHSTGKSNMLMAGFGVLYSFCGFFIAYYWNVMWLDAMYLLPVIVLGIERIIRERKCGIYIAGLFLAFISNYYMALMLCIFSVVYFLVYYFGNYSLVSSYKEIPQYVDSNGKLRKNTSAAVRSSRILTGGLTFAGASLLAAGLAAFALLPVYFTLKSCSATSGTFPKDFKEYFHIFDFLANHLASVDPTIRSSGEIVLPNVYCGIATVLLVPLYFFIKSEKLSAKVANVAVLAIMFYSFNTNYANYVWHGFHFPNDLPYRFSFIYSFLLLRIAYKTLTHLDEIGSRALLCSGICTLLFITVVEKVGSKNVEDYTVFISIAFVVIYTVYFTILKNEKKKNTAMALFLCLVMVEAMAANTDRYVMSQLKVHYISNYDTFTNVKNKLDEREKGSFYRMELADLNTRMDPSWYYYNGVSTFSSMAYERTSNVQSRLGLNSNYINSYTYSPQTPVYNAMMSLKYVVDNSSDETLNDEMYTYLFKSENEKWTAYSTTYCLPIGYCVGSDITDWDISPRNPFEVQGDYFRCATGISDVFVPLSIENEDDMDFDDSEDASEGSMFFSNADIRSSDSVSFTITPLTTQTCYLYLDGTDIEGLTITSDTMDEKRTLELSQRVIDIGVCQAFKPVYITVDFNSTYNGALTVNAYGINMTQFRSGFRQLQEGQLNVEKFGQRDISGSVTAEKDCVFYTSIPYDESWSVKVDGKQIPIKDYVAIGTGLLGFKLKAGEHRIELNYMPQGLILGSEISAGSLLLLIAIFVIKYIISRTRQKRELIINEKIIPDGYEPLIVDRSEDIGIGKSETVGGDDADIGITEYEIRQGGQTETGAEFEDELFDLGNGDEPEDNGDEPEDTDEGSDTVEDN
ncbi:MAG: YfhO family protein [Clostridiales bacterium]|nr:YfhO family protein [Clostridiales bacterium]